MRVQTGVMKVPTRWLARQGPQETTGWGPEREGQRERRFLRRHERLMESVEKDRHDQRRGGVTWRNRPRDGGERKTLWKGQARGPVAGWVICRERAALVVGDEPIVVSRCPGYMIVV